MKRSPYYVLALGVWAVMANALAISEPTKRRDAGFMYQPDPTPMVKMLELRHLELGKRQATTSAETTFTLVISPDKTCGFLSGSPGNAITCENGDNCSWELAHLTAIFCGTTAYNRCLNRADAINTKLCDDVCQSNSYNLLCTDRSAPYCGTYAYPSGVKGFRCASATLTRDQSAEFTYNNQDNRDFSTTLVSDAEESTLIESETTESSTGRSTTTDSATSTTEEPEPSDTDDSDSGGGGTNVGAIVGGAIGGFVALSLVVLGAIWMWRKNKKPKDPPAEQPTAVPPPGPTYHSGPVPHPNIPEAPADEVPPMSQYYPKTGVGSPTQSEWRDSMISSQNPNSPVSTWTGPHSTGGQTTPYQGAPPNYNHPH
ncbi:hypothetical protein FSARC_13409 [Fusarium sarcochroum]|uniref:Mid2 domain-containing protein n=1 Tax=Fusarium sarcochroum TaxID=1208366 RepID=A0A8H4T1N6_9HYPO|nr:hypothetical protein FSARC_13409 [Fusarium sarcochroum]